MGSFSDTPSLVASGTVAPYTAIKISGRNTGNQATANTDFVVGVTDGSVRRYDSANHAEDGDAISLQGGAVVLVKANGASTAIVAGDLLKVTTGGVFIKATAAAAFGTGRSFYIALEPAAADGLIIRALRTYGPVMSS
jgi:hypothetical protein